MVNPKNSFWLALVFTIIVFSLGLVFGYFVESYRADKTQENLLEAEVNFLDQQARINYYGALTNSCEFAKRNLFDAADRIYYDAMSLENQDSSSKFVDSLMILHKKYDLLRISLWQEALLIKKECNQDFHVLVYFFDYKSENIDLIANQGLYSRLLTDMKEKYPDKILLLPIAMNLKLSSIEIILEEKDISNAPAIMIDNGFVIQGKLSFDEFESILFNRNKQ